MCVYIHRHVHIYVCPHTYVHTCRSTSYYGSRTWAMVSFSNLKHFFLSKYIWFQGLTTSFQNCALALYIFVIFHYLWVGGHGRCMPWCVCGDEWITCSAFLFPSVGASDKIQLLKLSDKHSYLPNHLVGPRFLMVTMILTDSFKLGHMMWEIKAFFN